MSFELSSPLVYREEFASISEGISPKGLLQAVWDSQGSVSFSSISPGIFFLSAFVSVNLYPLIPFALRHDFTKLPKH